MNNTIFNYFSYKEVENKTGQYLFPMEDISYKEMVKELYNIKLTKSKTTKLRKAIEELGDNFDFNKLEQLINNI